MKLAAQIKLTPRDGHQRADLRPLQRLLGDQLLDRGDLAVEEVDVADPGVDGLGRFQRQLKPAQPSAAP